MAATKSKTKTNAITLLKSDQKKVKDLFDDFEDTDDENEKQEIAQQAMKELKIHSAIEEEIFYPAVRAQLDEEDQEIMDEAEEEHRVAKTVLEELENSKGSEHFEAKFTVMAENVRHHIKEEEGEMFKQVKDLDLDLNALGEQMLARKEELEGDESALEEAVEKSEVKPYQELGV